MIGDTAGDPISGLKWSRKTTEKLSRQLRKMGIVVSANTVARLLKKQGYSLRVNHKSVSHSKSPHRDQQFKKIFRMRKTFDREQLPVISVDTKKKEQVGQFKNQGAVWTHNAVLVYDHDFKRYAIGTAIPFGIYDTKANHAHVCVGVSHDTAAFAVDAVVNWWQSDGQQRYPNARRLLILADNGGGNGSKNRAWKLNLQTKLSDVFNLSVTVCHYPPGTSKWNPIEHRVFSEISKNWSGQPLNSYETVLKYISTTKTDTGLAVTSVLLRGDYPTGLKIPKGEMERIRLYHHPALPDWNYTIRPTTADA